MKQWTILHRGIDCSCEGEEMFCVIILTCYLKEIYPGVRPIGKVILFPIFCGITLVLIGFGIFEFFTLDVGLLALTLLRKDGSVEKWKDIFRD